MFEHGGRQYEKVINLALQGGGAHGAFTWGVLDRILEDERIFIAAISGTSAGAMNAVVCAYGLVKTGQRAGARQALADFWRAVARMGLLSPLKRMPVDVAAGSWSLGNNPSYLATELVGQLASPYLLNPFNLNPLRELLESTLDFDLVRACNDILVYVSATNVETGRVEVFDRKHLRVEMLLASACLPTLYQAVEIDGVPYWDGGFMGNPVLFPFYRESPSNDILIVPINPLYRAGTPRTARAIQNRMNEITFNGSLLHELRAIEFVGRLIATGKLSETEYRKLNLHIVGGVDELYSLDASSKLNTEWAFLQHLFERGRWAADQWLGHNYDHLNQRSSIDLAEIVRGDIAAVYQRHLSLNGTSA